MSVNALVAQLVEQWICNPKVVRSNRTGGTIIRKYAGVLEW